MADADTEKKAATGDEKPVEAPRKSKAADEPAAFTETTWQGQPLYECARCPVNTLDKAAMLTHQQLEHGQAYPSTGTESIDAPVTHYDRFGNVVKGG